MEFDDPRDPPRAPVQAPATWNPSGVVSLLTDFGASEIYVGAMKGVLLAASRGLAIVDLTHEIPPQGIRAAAFQLARAWSYFPEGTVHVAVVDPGVGTSRRILVAQDRGHAFLAPDNGLLGPVLSSEAAVFALDVDRFSLPKRSATFHGRDVFAPAAARIADGLAPSQCGVALAHWKKVELPRARGLGTSEVQAEVVLVDRFGNLVTNVAELDLEGAPDDWIAEAAGERIVLRRAYGEVRPGELLALVDSFGSWELAERDGHAARRLAAVPGSPVVFRKSQRTL